MYLKSVGKEDEEEEEGTVRRKGEERKRKSNELRGRRALRERESGKDYRQYRHPRL